jgi:hypothetical protein
MKRNTLILVTVAIVFGAFVYYFEIRKGKPRDEAAETTKPAFNFKREEIASIKLTRGGQTLMLENQNDKWVITQPVNTPADESTASSLVSGLIDARVERTLKASAEELKGYGLGEPAVILEIKLKNGEQHTVRLGSKDFSGLSVYGQLDQSQEVVLLPVSLLNNADKSLDDLRDRNVFGLSQYDLSSLALNNEHGRIALTKQEGNWKLTSPVDEPADETEMRDLLSELTSAKVAEFVSEAADELAKYGLDKPKVRLTAQIQGGGERTLDIGSKVEERYYAKSSDRPQIFKIESSLYDKLNIKFSALRDRQFLKLNKDDLTKVRIKNPNLTVVAEKNQDNKWLIKEPADNKDKEITSTYRLFDPLENKATEVLDKPPASAAAKLAKPAVEVQLTYKDGKTTTLRVSAADGDQAYVRVEGRSAVYKVDKKVVEDLSFKITDLIP